MNLYQHAKNRFIASFHSSDTVSFRVHLHDWPYPFLTMSAPKIFNHFLIYMNLYPDFFSKKWAAIHNVRRASSTMAKFRKISWSNSKKTPGQTSGGKDGQSLFHRILPATAGRLTSTTALDWHLKVKDKKCDIGLTKTYCITVRMQKIINSVSRF